MSDETDFDLFSGKKSKAKHDKADAAKVTAQTRDVTPPTSQIIQSRPTDEEFYRNTNPYVGVAVIFNHKYVKGQKDRVGTEKDRDTIAETLSLYGFDVRVFNDLTFEKVDAQLKAIAKEDHSENDCFVLVVMSHGAEGRIFASDMSYPVERLWQPFLGDNCKSLINKPKIFFLQACRGERLDKPVVFSEFSVMTRQIGGPSQAEEIPPVITYAIPNTADMLVMYSTFEKYYSFRNVENGSWFIQSLCDVFIAAARKPEAYDQGSDLLRLLTAVNRKVAYEYQSLAKVDVLNQMKEMPNFLSTLTKTFYLRVKSHTGK
ncbi:PREDICTED: caspase-3 [Bactrocera latifrons]|uniref:Caspase-1 n=2 Tax=Bactrocera latifrons TaxID=174628 RepID=A0A0K8WD42_BACLA|nr:PREDICTED: caspase-3 [Bactrocera latifrons]